MPLKLRSRYSAEYDPIPPEILLPPALSPVFYEGFGATASVVEEHIHRVLLVTSSPGRKEAERGVVVNSDSGRVAKVIEGLDTSWSSTSVFLDRQLVDALKMSEAYGVLAEEGKEEGEEGVVVTSMSHHRSYHTSPLLGLGVLILH
ncbi:hypothetical protein FRB93_003012 [Tulasnella sp. JGI-2019a]|nr:hypothetical protein FRB93_003012 [Tulasnella sp. JGI-2019a]